MGLLPSIAAPAAAAETRAAAPVVSVCIANWNCKAYLRACLASLHRRPQGVPFETVVVDNASTDGAADMVAAEFPTVTLIRNAENVGFSVANNQAAAVAGGNYLFFLNNDTVVPPHTLRKLVAYGAARPGFGMAGPRLRGADGLPQISYRRRPTLAALLHRVGLVRWTGLFRRAYADYRRDTFAADGVRDVEILMGAAVFLPRAVFDAAGKWDEGYRFGGEDLDLSTRVGRTNPVVYLGSVEIVHYGRVASRANAGFVGPNVAVGYVRYLRAAGVGPAALFAYKLLVTLDAPPQLLVKLAQTAYRRAAGDPGRAAKSSLAAREFGRFLRRELGRFWRA